MPRGYSPRGTDPDGGYRTRLAGEVREEVVPQHDYRHPADFRERVIDFALKAAEEAVAHGGIDFDRVPPERWGVVMGTCNAGLLAGERWYMERMKGGTPDPQLLMLVPPQALAEAIGGAFRLKGPVLSVDTACAAGANAIGYAADLIRHGHADVILAGGSDALSDVLISGFNALESLSPRPPRLTRRTARASRSAREAACCSLCARTWHGKRGCRSWRRWSVTDSPRTATIPTAPHPEGKGACRAIRAALKTSGIAAEEVGYVNSHGTGTPKNDPAETRATRLGLGQAADRVAVSSTKSMIGHLLGAAGAVEGIITVMAFRSRSRRRRPTTPNLIPSVTSTTCRTRPARCRFKPRSR